MRKLSTYGVLLIILPIIMMKTGQSRFVTFDSAPANELVSDGVGDGRRIGRSHDRSFLVLKGIEGVEEEKEEEKCKHMYGFLPCTSNLAGHLFLVVVYEYLLFLGEKYVARGSNLLFQMLGPGFFGACAFDVLGALPEALIVLVSGLPTKESAQEQVFTGIGLLVGSSVLLLTLVWGTCVIVGRQDFSIKLTDLKVPNRRTTEAPKSARSIKISSNGKRRSCFLDSGVATDKETSYTAMIMMLSVFPFIVLQLPEILNLSSKRGVVLLISLVISITLLLIYFLHQVFSPWIQKRRLEYVKHENLMVGFLKHVQRYTSGKLLTSSGAPNTPAIKRLFSKIDIDDDDAIVSSELKHLVMDIKYQNKELEEIMKDFDINHDNKISRDEFINGFIKWLNRRKQSIENEGSSSRNRTQIDLYQEKMKEYATNKCLILRILKHVQQESLRSLVNNEGKPNMPSIEMLFRKFDLDGDNYISLPELKKLIQQVEFGDLKVKIDDVAERVMEEIDTDGDHKINKKEFVDAIRNLFEVDHGDDHQEPREDLFLEAWNETDKLVDGTTSEKATNGVAWNWFKSIGMMLLGTVILTLLADPLIKAVQNFSKAANIHSFFVSFVAVPLATRSRVAMSAINSARRKKARTTSLTFSEIYGVVFMNNVLGLSVLLALVHVRGLRWDFSAEVLVVVIICVVMGLFASLRSKFPLWTSFIAFLLYPFSLFLVYLFNSVWDGHEIYH